MTSYNPVFSHVCAVVDSSFSTTPTLHPTHSNGFHKFQVNALLIHAYIHLHHIRLVVLSSPHKNLAALVRLWVGTTMAALAIAARSAYQQSFDARPYTTLAATNGALSAVGDVVAQLSQIFVCGFGLRFGA